MKSVDAILEAIARLSPGERAVLWRRARAMKLLNGDDDEREQVDRQNASAERLALELVFDGGSRGNPGPGYGSYVFLWPDRPPEVHRLELGSRMTNNEAEYDTLIAALEALLERLTREGIDPGQVSLSVGGDSQLVINQLRGTWRVREPRLRRRWERIRDLLARFGRVTLRQHPRERSVALLGH